VLFALAASTTTAVAAGSDTDDATYSVTFVPSWNPASHPPEYPLSHAKQGLLTPIIGATHGSGYRIFAEGTPPSAGLEKLSETGKHNPLDDEIRRAIAAGQASALIEFADGSPGPVHQPVAHTFRITRAQPFVSLAGMIAPSPDWFYGVSAVELLRNGQWVPSVVVQAYAWDSGGDAGTTYMAEDMDLATKTPTQRVGTAHFVQHGQHVPVGVFVFKQVPAAR
jgi:hypothetical protein